VLLVDVFSRLCRDKHVLVVLWCAAILSARRGAVHDGQDQLSLTMAMTIEAMRQATRITIIAIQSLGMAES